MTAPPSDEETAGLLTAGRAGDRSAWIVRVRRAAERRHRAPAGQSAAPLETRYGPVTAIGVSASVFWLAHLNHPSGFARLPALAAMGIALGALAYCADSILPAILTHATADAVAFLGGAFHLGPDQLWEPPLLARSGIDAAFVATLAVLLASGVAAALALRRLKAASRISPG